MNNKKKQIRELRQYAGLVFVGEKNGEDVFIGNAQEWAESEMLIEELMSKTDEEILNRGIVPLKYLAENIPF
jgi:hypothetical protein